MHTIIRTNTQIGDFQAFDTVDIEPFVHDSTMFGDGVPFARSHGACTQRVPGGFDMALDPFFDVGDVFGRVGERLTQVTTVGVQVAGRR